MTDKHDDDLDFSSTLEHLDRESSHVTVRLELRRFGKPMTIVQVHGVPKNDDSIVQLGKRLKRDLAAGGTVKDGLVELQGDHRPRMKEELLKLGFSEDRIEIF